MTEFVKGKMLDGDLELLPLLIEHGEETVGLSVSGDNENGAKYSQFGRT